MPLTKKYTFKQWLDIINCQQYTVRLLLNHTSDIKLHATGVFVSINNSKFLLTAAHVVENYDKLLIPLDSNTVITPGGTVKFSLCEGSRERDSYDIAIIELDKDTVNILRPYYNFLPEKNILINHNPNKSLFYTYLGYPSTYSKISYTKDSFNSKVFFHYNFLCDEQVYNKLNRSPTTNIIVKYDKQNSINMYSETISVGPDLFGMSGCGLWFTDPNDIFSKTPNPKLVAIMTDWPIKNRKCVVGIKMNVVVNAINREFNF